MEWDDEVDVLCTGSGVGGLATAIAAVDAGVDVFVADSLGLDVGDDETNQYFDELSQDLCIPVHRAPAIDMPITVNEDLVPAASTSRRVEPFIGSRLRIGSRAALLRPMGSSTAGSPSARPSPCARAVVSPSRSPRSVPSSSGPDLPQVVLADWLYIQARDRGIEVCTDSPLQRIVFEDGHVLGAVLDAPSGAFAVGARHGVLVSTGGHDHGGTVPSDLPDNTTLQVSVVRQAPSRFGRIELLTTQPLRGSPHTTRRPIGT